MPIMCPVAPLEFTNYVPVDKETLLSKRYTNIFPVGDVADIPTSKSGSVAHFEMDLFPDNFLRHVRGLQMTQKFDGHANCFIETGRQGLAHRFQLRGRAAAR